MKSIVLLGDLVIASDDDRTIRLKGTSRYQIRA
jgi:hypothetical protein